MKFLSYKHNLVLLSFSSLIIMGCSTDDTQIVTTMDNLVMADEFDVDGAPDATLWNYDMGNGSEQGIPGWGNNELQYYTDRTDNIVVEDGMLKITALSESYEGASYTSARINTKDLFEQKYGRFEARIQLPWGQGLWPAFWLLGANSDEVIWPACGEIDIMENRGSEPTIVNGTIHGPGYSGGESVTKLYDLVNDRFDTGFHVFGIEWDENYINFYVDDVLYNQLTPNDIPGDWIFNDQPFYIIMNVAVGGNYGGVPNENTVFPQQMLVDYVRVYSK
ncbi:glycoside hydrolase family 16 protein [Mangrovimonas spongiae]|uniref:Glycoside hydrolase family 16 protein n=1 Tax=Mangrovimonas spongiae TaxID=2494697 RepID=A0A428K4V2_9FLAO|nr:glycoside hydrolase family 16 protein [Mangrovimonas spongiae]RSK41431.1 glycoside hydrolase family 16 protein [Mangrovimonas spongiae]